MSGYGPADVSVKNYAHLIIYLLYFIPPLRGLYIGKYLPPPWGGEISADVIFGKKQGKGEEKKGKM